MPAIVPCIVPRRLALLLGAAIVLTTAAAQELSRADADSVSAKLARMEATAAAPRPANAPPRRTSFTEREINAYFEHYGPTFLPAGIARPRVAIGADGRIEAQAIVDLDAVRLARPRGLLDPLAFVRGALEVVAAGRIEGAHGQGVVRFESATVGGVAVPESVAQELLRFYTSTPERPAGIAFDTPFELPLAMRSVAAARGGIAVTQ
jgi:hypothetical protein